MPWPAAIKRAKVVTLKTRDSVTDYTTAPRVSDRDRTGSVCSTSKSATITPQTPFNECGLSHTHIISLTHDLVKGAFQETLGNFFDFLEVDNSTIIE